jgi:hypothetical protein
VTTGNYSTARPKTAAHFTLSGLTAKWCSTVCGTIHEWSHLRLHSAFPVCAYHHPLPTFSSPLFINIIIWLHFFLPLPLLFIAFYPLIIPLSIINLLPLPTFLSLSFFSPLLPNLSLPCLLHYNDNHYYSPPYCPTSSPLHSLPYHPSPLLLIASLSSLS